MPVQIKVLTALMKYKGIKGTVEWKDKAGQYRAVVKNQGAETVFQADGVKSLLRQFRACVDDILNAAEADSFLRDSDAPPDSDEYL
jgi:hypothetical protein